MHPESAQPTAYPVLLPHLYCCLGMFSCGPPGCSSIFITNNKSLERMCPRQKAGPEKGRGKERRETVAKDVRPSQRIWSLEN